MIRRPPRSTLDRSSAASDVYKRQNMAHGEMVMIGAYVTFVVQQVIRTSFPGLFDYSLLIAVPLAFLVAGAIGVLIERGIIRFLYGRPLETLLATWGLSLVLQQAVRTAFGPTNREVCLLYTSPSPRDRQKSR